MEFYTEPSKQIPVKEYDVVVAGGGTGGVLAAVAAARAGARTALVECKGYVGGTAVEGGTGLHSFYNLARAFNVPARQLVRGLPQELIDRLVREGGCTGFAPAEQGYGYDEVATVVDVEIYKLVAANMLEEAGVTVYYNTLLADAVTENGSITGAIIQNRSGRQMLAAHSFIDATGYGDLCAYAGAEYIEPNDQPVANSVALGGVSMEGFYEFFKKYDAVSEVAYGSRDGEENRIIRVSSTGKGLPEEFTRVANEIGMHLVTTTVHNDYFMFVKLNYVLPTTPADADAVSLAELELRRRMAKAVELIRKFIPGCEHAYATRSAPSMLIRRARAIICDYDLTIDDIVEGRHFEDDICAYGFHDCAPRIQIKNGGSYGIPYRALLVKGIENLFATGMMITTDWVAQMSTRNTVSCMAQGQAAGIAAALAARMNVPLRGLPYSVLKKELLGAGVYLEN